MVSDFSDLYKFFFYNKYFKVQKNIGFTIKFNIKIRLYCYKEVAFNKCQYLRIVLYMCVEHF